MHNSEGILTPAATKLRLSPTLEINEWVREARASGKHVIHLGFGEATFPIQENVLQAHRDTSETSAYLPVAGLESLRTAIAKYQSARTGISIQSDQVVVAPGSKPLLFALFDILDGDVLLPRPSWVSYEPQVAHAGKKLFWVETDEHDRHTLTDDALTTAYNTAVEAGGRPRIMLVNSPSNPTGQAFSRAQAATIGKFCKERDIILISDEIYSDICFSPENRRDSAFEATTREGAVVIMTGGLSKTYSAGGWRLGFAIFPDSTVGRAIQIAITAYASECWSTASAPVQVASVLAFATKPTTDKPIGSKMDNYRDAVTSLHRLCTLRLYNALKDCSLEVAEPKGAFYVYPSFRPFAPQLRKLGIMTSRALSKWLIEECGLATLPGSAFGEKDEEEATPRGGDFRLRMATSYLYFSAAVGERYKKGYALLAQAAAGENVDLPLLEEAINAIQAAVEKLKAVQKQKICPDCQ